jgi:PHD/YefM family antitoxin component YafN of YafNO toxin-antitoxin module
MTMAKTVALKESPTTYTLSFEAAYLDEEPIIVEREGKPFAVIIRAEDYERFRAWQRDLEAGRIRIRECDPRMGQTEEEWHAHFQVFDRLSEKLADVSPQDFDALIDEAVAAVRTEKYTRNEGQR